MNTSRVAFTSLIVTAGLLLTGCTGSLTPSPHVSNTPVVPIGETPSATMTVTASPSATPSRTPVASVTKSASAPKSATPSRAAAAPSSAPKTDPNAPAGQCADKDMLVSVQQDPKGGGDGQRRAFVVIENISNSTCALRGYPGVSLVGGGNGTQIGQPAIKNGSDVKTIQVGRGDYLVAVVTYVYIDKNEKKFSDGSVCNAKHADGYRVYPPHSYKSVFTAFDSYACSGPVDWIAVGAVEQNHYDFEPQLGK